MEFNYISEAAEGELTYNTLPPEIKNAIDKNQTVGVAFVKKDGTVRHMAFRRHLNAYVFSDKPKTEKQQNASMTHNQMTVYDTNAYIRALNELGGDKTAAANKSFRIITLHNVLGFLHGGKFYDMRENNNIMNKYGENVYNQLTKNMVNAMNVEVDKGEVDMEKMEVNQMNEQKHKKSKQRLFEVMTRLDKTFKFRLNENSLYEINLPTKEGKTIKVDIQNNREIYINDIPIDEMLEAVGDVKAIGNFSGGETTFSKYFNWIMSRPDGVSEETLINNSLLSANVKHLVKEYDLYTGEDEMRNHFD